MKEKVCHFCDDEKQGARFMNWEESIIKYMPPKVPPHLECYIEECIRQYMEEDEQKDNVENLPEDV
jgi:hypothetical protein